VKYAKKYIYKDEQSRHFCLILNSRLIRPLRGIVFAMEIYKRLVIVIDVFLARLKGILCFDELLTK
jgi:hypothetical protein